MRWQTDSTKIALNEREAGDGETEWSWRVENFAPRQPEPDMPLWHFHGRFIQVSDFASWQPVASGFAAAWAEDLDNPELLAAAREIAAATDDLADRVERALRLVQDELRYLSVNTELGGQIPASPGTVLRRRFGDCKDKALLLAHLLRRLGVSARPVLVHSRFRHKVAQFLPMPAAFDHVIVEYEMEGERRWVDATISFQGGGPLRRALPGYGMGLPLQADVTALESIVSAKGSAGLYEICDVFRLRSSTAPLVLVSTVKATGPYADDLRRQITMEGLIAAGQAREKLCQQHYVKARRHAPTEWRDDRVRNEVIVADAFLIPETVVPLAEPGFAGFVVHAHLIRSVLGFSDSDQRKQPLALPFPCCVEHRIECEFETPFTTANESLGVRTDEFSYEAKCTRMPAVTILRYTCETRADHVAPQHFTTHRQKVLQALGATQFAIHLPTGRRFVRNTEILGNLLPPASAAGATQPPETVPAAPVALGGPAAVLQSKPVELAEPALVRPKKPAVEPVPATEATAENSNQRRSRRKRRRTRFWGLRPTQIAGYGTAAMILLLILLRLLLLLV
jgi:hypothetical protein